MVCRHPLNFHPFDLIKTFELEGQCPEWFCGLLIFLRISFTDIIIYDLFIMLRFFSSVGQTKAMGLFKGCIALSVDKP